MTVCKLGTTKARNTGIIPNVKPIKRAVAVVITNENNEFLIIKRPAEDLLGAVWGFPALNVPEGQTEEEVVRLIGPKKLGVVLEIGNKIGTQRSEREEYILELSDYFAKIISGEPTVPQSDTSLTQYTDWQFTNEPNTLVPAARNGSVCTRVYLTHLGLKWDET